MARFFQVFTLACLLVGPSCFSQQTHHYAIVSGQPPALVADAGEDVIFAGEGMVLLGGVSVAIGGTEPYTYSWTPSANLSDPESATPAVTSADEDVTFTLTVTDNEGCRATDNVTVFAGIITSVPSGREIPFTIYSNTTRGWITIRTAANGGTVQLLDIRGNTVLMDELNAGEHYINTAHFPAGIYVLRLAINHDIHTVKLLIP